MNEKVGLPYTMGKESGLKKSVYIEKPWRDYMIDNNTLIISWIQLKMAMYIQQRNPERKGILSMVSNRFE